MGGIINTNPTTIGMRPEAALDIVTPRSVDTGGGINGSLAAAVGFNGVGEILGDKSLSVGCGNHITNCNYFPGFIGFKSFCSPFAVGECGLRFIKSSIGAVGAVP